MLQSECCLSTVAAMKTQMGELVIRYRARKRIIINFEEVMAVTKVTNVCDSVI